MKKLIITWNKKKIKIDLGKADVPVFELIMLLTSCIRQFATSGYEQEEKLIKYYKEVKKNGNC